MYIYFLLGTKAESGLHRTASTDPARFSFLTNTYYAVKLINLPLTFSTRNGLLYRFRLRRPSTSVVQAAAARGYQTEIGWT